MRLPRPPRWACRAMEPAELCRPCIIDAGVRAVLCAALCPTNGLGNAAIRCGLSQAARLVELKGIACGVGAAKAIPQVLVAREIAQRVAIGGFEVAARRWW